MVAVAAATSTLLLWAIGDPLPWARFLWRLGAEPFAVALVWAVVAPVPLAVAALARRHPWWWVAAVTLHLAALVAVTVRLRHLVPVPLAATVVLLAVVGALSCVAALSARPGGRAPSDPPPAGRSAP